MPELRTPLDSLMTDLRAQQLDRWEAGERVLLESLLAGHPELLADQEALLHLINLLKQGWAAKQPKDTP